MCLTMANNKTSLPLGHPVEVERPKPGCHIQDRHRPTSAVTMTDPGNRNMTEAKAAEHIYMMSRRAKMSWRRFTGKPARKAQRAFRLSQER